MTKFIDNLNDFQNIIFGKKNNELDIYFQSPIPDLNNHQETINIFYFTAKWCKPCQQLIPSWDNLEKKYQNTCSFYKVDVDNGSEIA